MKIFSDKLHVGCGDTRLPGFFNIDARATLATDLVGDCADLHFLPAQAFQTVFSHAFFEHLFIFQRVRCLQSIHRVLKDQGTVVFIGIPDFRRIAQAYLRGEVGATSSQFDLFQVYRYTHGNPEQSADWWLAQLHKSLFDQQTVAQLLDAAGFPAFCVFRYCFRQEGIPLNLGFVGFKRPPNLEITRDWLIRFLWGYTTDVNADTVEMLSLTPG